MYPLLFSKSHWNKWKMKHAKFWKVLCQILFRFWKNEERFWRGQCCVEKALNESLFWYDQTSSWVQRKKSTSEIVKCTKKFCVPGSFLQRGKCILLLQLETFHVVSFIFLNARCFVFRSFFFVTPCVVLEQCSSSLFWKRSRSFGRESRIFHRTNLVWDSLWCMISKYVAFSTILLWHFSQSWLCSRFFGWVRSEQISLE